jgi:hypothetical protein
MVLHSVHDLCLFRKNAMTKTELFVQEEITEEFSDEVLEAKPPLMKEPQRHETRPTGGAAQELPAKAGNKRNPLFEYSSDDDETDSPEISAGPAHGGRRKALLSKLGLPAKAQYDSDSSWSDSPKRIRAGGPSFARTAGKSNLLARALQQEALIQADAASVELKQAGARALQLESQLVRAQEELGVLRRQKAVGDGDADVWATKVELLERQMAALRATNERVEAEHARLQAAYTDQQRAAAVLPAASDLEGLKAELVQSRMDAAAALAGRAVAEEACRMARAEVVAAAALGAELESAKRQLEVQVSGTRAQADEALEQLSAAQRQAAIALEEAAAARQAAGAGEVRLREHTSEILDLRSRLSAALQSMEEAQKSVDLDGDVRILTLENEASSLRAKLSDAEAALFGSQQSCAEASARALRAASDLTAAMQRAEQVEDRLGDARKQVEERDRQLVALHADVASLVERCTALESTRVDLVQQLTAAQKVAAAAEAARSELAAKATAARGPEEVSHLKQSLAASEVGRRDALLRIQTLQAERTAALHELAGLRTQASELQSRLAAAEEQTLAAKGVLLGSGALHGLAGRRRSGMGADLESGLSTGEEGNLIPSSGSKLKAPASPRQDAKLFTALRAVGLLYLLLLHCALLMAHFRF